MYFPKTLSQTCPACHSTQISWDSHLDKVYLGCDQCSETIRIFRLDEITEMLNKIGEEK